MLRRVAGVGTDEFSAAQANHRKGLFGMKPLRIFISSVQKEFSADRIALRDWLRNDALMHRFFEPFLFEDVPAADRRADAFNHELVTRITP